MLVRDVMQSEVVSVTAETTLPEALNLVQARRIRHLPVLAGGELVGIVSDRDLKRAMASPATSLEAHELQYLLERLRLGEIMTRSVITVGPNLPVEEAARVMVLERISALPVTEGRRLVGIVTETDVVDLFVRAMGAGEPSSRLEVSLAGRGAALGEIVSTVESAGLSISSVMTLKDRTGHRKAVIRSAGTDPRPALEALRGRGFVVQAPGSG